MCLFFFPLVDKIPPLDVSLSLENVKGGIKKKGWEEEEVGVITIQ